MKQFMRILSAVICLIMMLHCMAACGTPSGGSGTTAPDDGSTTNPNDDATGGGSANGGSDPIDPGETLYTLVYKGGDGATGQTPTALRAAAGEKLVLGANTFIKSGYTFVGWSDGTATYAPGDEFTMPAKNVDMTAQWQVDAREQVEIRFNTLGGGAVSPITVGKGEDAFLVMLPQAYKDGFVFSEWFLDEALTMPFYSNVITVNEAVTLYAGYYEVGKKEATYLGTGESSLTSQDANTVIMLDSFGVELTQENYTDYITVTNNYEIKETPNLLLEASGDMYLLRADPAWPTGGNFYIEAKEPVKIIVETEGDAGEPVELAVSKLFFTVHVGENHVELAEKSHIIEVGRDDYFAYLNDDLYLTTEFAFGEELAVGKILKVFDENGNFEYMKIGAMGSADFGGTTAVVAHTVAPSLNEIYNEFKLSYTEANIDSADYIQSIDENEVVETLTQSEGMQHFQNMTTAMVADYATQKKFAQVGSIQLLDGSTIDNEDLTGGGYNAKAYIDLNRSDFGIDDETGDIYGTWFVVLAGTDQYAAVTIRFGASSSMWISADGDFDIDMDVNWPWDDDFLDVSANIWFDVYLGHSQYIDFSFEIIYYNNGVAYNAREQFENNNPYDYPDNFVQKYKDLISMDNTDITIFAIDLFVFRVDILNVINVQIPVGVELSMSINGSFALTTTSNTVKYYGIKGDINQGFESYSGETYCYTNTGIYYNGSFGVMAGVYVAVDLSVLNLSKLGSVGIEVGFGVYYDFYGYGYTYTWYKKQSADTRFETNVTETGGTEDFGVAFSEFGIYFKIGIYAKSDIFKLKAEATKTWKIPLIQTGDRYLLLGFTDAIEEYAKTGVVIGDAGVNLFDLGLHYYEYLDVREGEAVTRIAAEIPEGKDLTFENMSRYGEFAIQFHGYVQVDQNGHVKIADRCLGRRVATTFTLWGYIGGGRKADHSNELSISIPLTYIPDSMGLDHDRLDETVHVTFMVDDVVYHEMDVGYGYSLLNWVKDHPDAAFSTLQRYGADDAFYSANPKYQNVRWKAGEFSVVLTEDRVYHASFNEKLIFVTYRYIYGIGDEPAWTSVQLALPSGTWLYDALPTVADAGAKVVVNDEQPWSVADKQLDFADDGLVVEAQYEYLPITLTVQIDAFASDEISIEAATHTYTLTAGDTVWPYLKEHLNSFYQLYSGYNPDLYGVWWMAYVKDADVYANTKIYWNDIFNIGWTTENLEVAVYDHNGEVLLSRTVDALSDQSALMQEEAVQNVAKTYRDENGITWEFKGWLNKNKLNKVTEHVVILPIYHKASHNVTLDPNGGRFDLSLMLDENGNHITEVLSGDTFTLIDYYHKVVMDSTDTEVYTFNGWYYLDANGEKIFEFKPVTEDITYYADWVTGERTWEIQLFATGSDWDTTVEGIFADTNTDLLTYRKNYADTTALIDAILAGDFSVLPTPTAIDTNYAFVKWNVVEFVGRRFELYPVYQNNGTATVVIDIGEGKMYRDVETNDYLTGQFTLTLTHGETWGLASWGGWQPAATEVEVNYALDEATGEFVQISNVCYEDEHYLYTFEGWETSDGESSWTFEAGQVVTVKALYKRHYKRLSIAFSVDYYADDPERINDSTSESVIPLYAAYGDVLDPAIFPVATKTIGNDPYDDSLWEYVFDHWECVETGETAVRLTVDGNREYKAVFRKEFRQVTVTFDAGENAIFPSTGERTFTLTVNRGTNFGSLWSMVETPVRTDNTAYVFYEWGGLADVSDVMNNETSPAIYWNTERSCFEGEEHMIQLILDTGDDNAVFEHSGSRYYTVMFEPGEVMVDDMSWSEVEGENEIPVGYLSNFVIVIDGENYVGIYDIELPFEFTMENDRTVVTVKELMTEAEYDAMLKAEYATA